MRIVEGIETRIGVFDIETYRELFDVGVFNPDTGGWDEFEISHWRNDLYKFVKYYGDKKFDYWVSFNGIGFDHQVIEYIVENYLQWHDLTGLEICGKIADFAGKIIDDQKYDIPLPYKEWLFQVKVIDLFRIHHFDNEAKRTSLKWVEYMLDIDVEEMPVPFYKIGLTQDEIEEVKVYRRHDVIATLCLLYVTLGELDKVRDLVEGGFGYTVSMDHLEDYRGKNMIQDRYDVEAETGMKCLNWADVKIGEEWNKLNYKIAENITDEKVLFSKRIKQPFGQKFKNFFPSTTAFTTPLFKEFIKKLGEEYVKNIKQEFPFKVGQTTYTVAKGGLHSNEKNRMLKPPKGFKLRDADVGGQYPNFIIKETVHAPHLKDTIITIAQNNVDKRTVFKKKAKELEEQGKKAEARPLMGLQEMLKLCNNGGLFGKLGQPGSFLHYPEGLLKVCLGNEVEILMLIEMMEGAGFQVVSGNTDGILVIYPEDKEEEYLKICKDWELKVGNIKNGKLEFADFECMWQDSINSYIGKKTNGAVKKKGKFLTTFMLNKNKSKRIIALALEAYFINGISPVEYISTHTNIFDFCIAKKAFGQLHYEEIISDKEVKVHKKLIRYFVSNDGNVMKKRGINNEGDVMDNHCEATDKDFPWMGQPKVTYFNRYSKKEMSQYNINYSYYILETLKRIDSIQKTKMAKVYADKFKTEQISLF